MWLMASLASSGEVLLSGWAMRSEFVPGGRWGSCLAPRQKADHNTANYHIVRGLCWNAKIRFTAHTQEKNISQSQVFTRTKKNSHQKKKQNKPFSIKPCWQKTSRSMKKTLTQQKTTCTIVSHIKHYPPKLTKKTISLTPEKNVPPSKKKKTTQNLLTTK